MYKMMLLAAGLLTSTAGVTQAIGPSIAYVKGSARGDAIYLVDPDGTGLTKVYQAPREGRVGSQIDRVTIKPDGGAVAFIQDSTHLWVQPFGSTGQPDGSAYEIDVPDNCALYDPDYRADGSLYVSDSCAGVYIIPSGATSASTAVSLGEVGALAAFGNDLLYVEVGAVGAPGTLKRRTSTGTVTTIASVSWNFPLYLDAAGTQAVLSESGSFRTIPVSGGTATDGCTQGGMVKYSPTGAQMVYEFRNTLLVHNSDCSGAPFRLARGVKAVAWRSN